MAEKVIGFGSPKMIIEQKIDECDGYLGIFDRRWGYIPRDNNPENLSVTAVEYQRSKKNRIPMLIFVSKKEKEKDLQEFIDKILAYENGDWRKDETELLRLITRGIRELVSKIQAQNSGRRVEDKVVFLASSPAVSPSIATYDDTIQGISTDEINFITEKILHSTNSDILLTAWRDLEIFTRNKRVWKHESVWQVLSKEMSDKADDAIFILKGICFTSKRDKTDEAILRVKQFYSQKLEDFLSSKEKKLHSKADIKQIFEFIFSEQERFHIFWKAWKNCVEIKDDDEYFDSIAAFISYMERADSKCKYSIRTSYMI